MSTATSGDHALNNFDLVRVFAAAQVVVVHLVSFMPGMHSASWLEVLSLFPGVPIFFFISGFLIGGSWRRNPNVAAYIASRALRIFPGLWAACLFSLALLLFLYSEPLRENVGTTLIWIAMQLSFLQSWNPQFLRGYGMGVANPVLWTIPVELAFYVVLPLLVILGQRIRRLYGVLIGAALISLLVCWWATAGLDPRDAQVETLRKVMTVSPLSFVSWVWMFLLGVLAQLQFDRLQPLIAGRALPFVLIAVAVGILSLFVDFPPLLHLPGNEIGLLNAVANGLACLAFAYSYPGLALRWLRGNDLSYGVYLYHMPLANALIAVGVVGWQGGVLVLIGTFVCAFLSWVLIERRALGLKSRLQLLLDRRSSLGREIAT
ncbi:acyltransferase family protein [Pseudorhodoferax soli]|uniref:Peptidoglycan/LPS O-acetylase OafA/YrhL n=1 Tax=Pseudorhodoferax soli TaxID=545864 RepID=A0A368Y747_9BURK|nr:acyltransferase [Pseudorhodoferax soli]RCW76042.1 peptidoglycan/LPS O-acetylase OafA/YrhL [Pseudorhodoferax soli]